MPSVGQQGRYHGQQTQAGAKNTPASPMRARPSQMTALASRSARVSGDSSALRSTSQESVCAARVEAMARMPVEPAAAAAAAATARRRQLPAIRIFNPTISRRSAANEHKGRAENREAAAHRGIVHRQDGLAGLFGDGYNCRTLHPLCERNFKRHGKKTNSLLACCF